MTTRLFDKRELKQTPSYKNDISPEEENKVRLQVADYIRKIGAAMELPYAMVASAQVLMNHFYMYYTISEFEHRAVAVTCLLVAGKAEETPKKLRDLLRACERSIDDTAPFMDDERDRVVSLESVMLQTLKFDVFVTLPHYFLPKFVKDFKASKNDLTGVLQTAWTFANDCVRTTLCLQWEPEIIAVALVHLSMRVRKVEIYNWHGRKGAKDERWWDQYISDLHIMTIEDICHSILDIYANPATLTSEGRMSLDSILENGPYSRYENANALPFLSSATLPQQQQLSPSPLSVESAALSVSRSSVLAQFPQNFLFPPNVPPPGSSFVNAAAATVRPPFLQSGGVAQSQVPLALNMLTSVPPPSAMYPVELGRAGFLPYPPMFPFHNTSVPPPPLPGKIVTSTNGQTVPPSSSCVISQSTTITSDAEHKGDETILKSN